MRYYIVIHLKMHFLQPNSRFQVTNENFYIVGKHLIFHVKLKRKKKHKHIKNLMIGHHHQHRGIFMCFSEMKTNHIVCFYDRLYDYSDRIRY